MRTRNRIIAVVQAVMMMVSFFTVSIPEAAAAEIEEIADQLMTDDDTGLKEQLITAELYTDATYSEPFLTDTQITISGEMPENAYVKSYPVSYDIEGMSVIAAYDITIFEQDGVTVFQPQEQALNVTFSMQELADTDPDALAVYHIGDDGEEEITDITAEDGSVSFDAEHFSVYVISEHEDSDKPISDKRIEFHFLSDKFDTVDEKQGIYTAGLFSFRNKGLNSDMTQLEIQHSQIVLNGETLEMIENPPNHSSNSETSPEQYFYGWYVVDLVERNSDSDIRYKWTDDPEPLEFEVPVTFSDSEWSQNGNTHELTNEDFDEDGCAHVYLAPLYTNYHFIDYHLYAHDNVTGDNPYDDTLLIRRLITFGANGKVNVRIGNISAPSPDAKHLVFVGWEREIKGNLEIDITVDNDGKERNYLSDVNDEDSTNADGYHIVCYYDELFKDGDEIIDANNIDLYPVFVEARWIDFNTNLAGSTYVPSRYLLSSELTGGLEELVEEAGIGLNIKKFPVSKRDGYMFQGWYSGEGADAVQLTDGDGNVLSNVTYENNEQKYGVKDGAFYVKDAPDVGENAADDAKNVKLYAKWQEITDTRYTVVIWKQKVTDDVDTPVEDREYDYEKSVHIDCRTGTTLNTIRSDLSTSSDETGRYYSVSRYVGFTPREPSMKGGNNNNTTVSSDRNTIINIYYDRNPHTIKFYDSYYTVNQSNNPPAGSTPLYKVANNTYAPIPDGIELNQTTTYYATKSNRSGSNKVLVHTINALYGQNIASEFSPVIGINNYKYSKERWKAEGTTSFSEVLLLIEEMPDESFILNCNNSNASQKFMAYYVEALPGNTNIDSTIPDGETLPKEVMYKGVKYQKRIEVSPNYNYFTEAEDYLNIIGFNKNGTDPQFDNNGEIRNATTVKMYYKRKSYEIKYKVNYPTDKLGLTYANKLTNAEYTSSYGKVLYEQPLNEYDEGGPKYWDISENAPDHYVFAGWYEDEEGLVKFDFDSTMPANNLVLYAKWEPVKFKIQVDPNGAEIDHINHKVANYCEKIYGAGNIPDGSEEIPTFKYSPLGNYNDKRATYFNIDYDEAIGEYSLSKPEYLPISDVAAQAVGVTIYYYVNTQLDESVGRVPADLRNALYLTESELESYYNFYTAVIDEYKKKEPHTYGNVQELSFAAWKHQYVSDQKYYKATNNTTTYLFRGWYEVDENGETAAMPYDFYDPVHSDIKLRAVWQMSGGFKIQYVPEYTAANGVIINGQMAQWQDPADNSNENYAEYAKVTVLKQPTHIMADGQPTDDYIFRGWQVVVRDGDKYIPMEDGVYYQPGEDYIIQSKFANDLNVIYMQAVYERDGSSYRRPEIANLKLDATDGQVDYTQLPEWIQWYGSDSVGHIEASDNNQLWIYRDMQSNAAVHLYKYATSEDYAGTGGNGHNYFTHPQEYFLLGFDRVRSTNENQDYIPDIASDAVVSLSRTDNETLYAVWEPTVYINFRNETDKPVKFALSADDIQTLYVINKVTNIYDREAVSDRTNITIPANTTVKLAIPYGEGKKISINGKNEFGEGQFMTISSEYPDDIKYPENVAPQHNDGIDYISNENNFSRTEVLGKHKNGLTVVFGKQEGGYSLVLSDPTHNTGDNEYDFTEDTLPSTFTLDETRAKLGYVFKGWAYTPNSTTEFYTVTEDTSQTLYLKNLFADPERYTQLNETLKQIKLYAVWEKDATTNEVYIHKDVPFPGNKDEEFAFTLNLTLRNNSATRSASETVYIRSGEYFLVKNTGFTAGGNYSKGSATSTITIYKKDGSTESRTLSVNMTANGLCSYNMTVTENEHPHYTATSEVVVYTIDDGYHINSSDSNVSWNNANAGGTVLFTNVRKTADVTVKKVVDDPKHLHDGKTFKFSAELKDGEQDYTYELASSEFSIEDGGSFKIEDVPVGAKLLISENEADFTTVVESQNGSVDTGTDSNVQTFLLEVPENDETLTFKNTVRTAKVEIYSWDGDKDVPFADARYSISTETYDKYPDKTSGLVWKFDDMFYGTYTIEQIWCDNTHEKINTPMTIQISGTTAPIVTSDNKFIEVEYDAGNQVYKVKILNYKKLIAPTGADISCTRALTALTISVSLVCAALYIVCSQRRKGGSIGEIL